MAFPNKLMLLLTTLLLVLQIRVSTSFTQHNGRPTHAQPVVNPANSSSLHMGLFDGISKAFSNQDFQSQDQRVRASHILLQDTGDLDADLDKIKSLLQEINDKTKENPDQLVAPVFAELARRESTCPSASRGGDLGLFAPGTMAPEFDEAVFPASSSEAPPPGAIVGPVITDFGMHIILVTQRELNKDQIEEKLARND